MRFRLRTSLPALALAVLALFGLAPAPAAKAVIVIGGGARLQPGTVIRIQPSSTRPAPSVQPTPVRQPAPAPQPAPVTQPAPAPQPATGDGPRIVGSDYFRSKVGQALQLLQTKAPAYWDIVRRNLLTIEEGSASGAFVWSRAYVIGPATLNSDPYWLASTIVHDAYHVQQYLERRPYAGQAAEAEAANIQKQALIAMGAPQYMVSHVDAAVRANTWWTVPYGQRGW